MACVTHETDLDALFPREFFDYDAGSSMSALSRLTAALSFSSATPSEGLHSFDIVASMLEDPDLARGKAFHISEGVSDPQDEDSDKLQATLSNVGDRILKYANQWKVDATDKDKLSAKLEELGWLASLIYGVGGLQSDEEFNADFILCV